MCGRWHVCYGSGLSIIIIGQCAVFGAWRCVPIREVSSFQRVYIHFSQAIGCTYVHCVQVSTKFEPEKHHTASLINTCLLSSIYVCVCSLLISHIKYSHSKCSTPPIQVA